MSQYHPHDILNEAEARVAFLADAALAFSEANSSMLPQKRAWAGLFYLLLDIQLLLKKHEPPTIV